MKTMSSPSKQSECISKDTNGSNISSWNMAVVICAVLFMFGGVSTVWAGDRRPSISPASPLHLTGFLLHVGPGGFHIGIGGFPRHGYLKGRVYDRWNKRGGKHWHKRWNKGGGKHWNKRPRFDNRRYSYRSPKRSQHYNNHRGHGRHHYHKGRR